MVSRMIAKRKPRKANVMLYQTLKCEISNLFVIVDYIASAVSQIVRKSGNVAYKELTHMLCTILYLPPHTEVFFS